MVTSQTYDQTFTSLAASFFVVKEMECFSVMKRLLHIFSLFLFRCNQADDFEPAKILMNMCFTFFLEVNKG